MKSKFSKVFWGLGALAVLVLGFIYLPLPGLEGPRTKSMGWRQAGMLPGQIPPRAEEHFRMLEASSNLQRPFPEMPDRAHNPTTPEKVELGRLLYFDPLLSADNDISCAHCHHPDLGFSDNRGLAMGRQVRVSGPHAKTAPSCGAASTFFVP